MIILLSPAKSIKEEASTRAYFTSPRYKKEAYELVKVLRQYQEPDLMKLMGISSNLALENIKRYKAFRKDHKKENSLIAIDTFDGDVYQGLQAQSWTSEQTTYAQDHLRILSGLYGVLKPLDLMHPYRLEMGTRLKTDRGNNLYQYWDDKITRELNKDLKLLESKTVINLASNEYYKAVQKDKLKANVISINFKEWRAGQLKFISFNAKRARGMMANYIIQNQLNHSTDIKGFHTDDYIYDDEHSTEQDWLFVR